MAETIHLTVQSQPPVGLTTEQARVIRAVSPTATVERIEGGAEVTITDYEQTTTAIIYDGEKGDPGEPGRPGSPGQPGVSPTASVEQTETGATVTVTDANGTTTANLTNGQDGEPGQDGVSPTITVTDIPGGHRVTITDATGPHSFDVMDGEDGQGAVQDVQVNGVSVLSDGVANVPVATTTSKLGLVQLNSLYGITAFGNGFIGINKADGNMIKAGTDNNRPIVPSNNNAATFYGFAKAAGDATQSASSNTVGQYTESAKSAISEMLNGSVTVSGTTPTINALPGVRYVCGEVSTIDINTPETGIVDVVFKSGSTPAVLTVTPPSGMTMQWANGFDPDNLEADTTYEINIADGCLGVAGTWT